jgi:hypothetical protein
MIVTLPDAAEREPSEEPVRWFQRTRGLAVDGVAGTETRHALIREYMGIDGTSLPKGIEVIPHGCGENFPAKATGTGDATEENRRVELFFFDGELGVQPSPGGKNSKAGSSEYPEWVKRTRRTEDHVIVPGQAIFRLRRLLDDRPIVGGIARIQTSDGAVIEQVADDEGIVRIDGVTGERFRLIEIVEDPERMMIATTGQAAPITA